MASDGEISCANDPNFAVIYSFLKTFGKLYGLDVPTLTKLQEFIENTQEVLDPLKELHLRLLRRAQKSVPSNRWERCMIKFCHQQGHHQEAWEIERFSYKKASTQVKLTVLKLLLEHQFSCHPKFKNAVNAITCKELRLDPVGRDKNGFVYWLQVDHEANLCLYKEDQDEETWQLVARSREELVKVISQLKSGEEVCPLVTSNVHEDSSSAEVPPQFVAPEVNKSSEVEEEENDEEFLSPESESEHEEQKEKEEEIKDPLTDPLADPLETPDVGDSSQDVKEDDDNKDTEIGKTPETSENKSIAETTEHEPEAENESKSVENVVGDKPEESAEKSTEKKDIEESNEEQSKEEEELGEAIEEPVMVVSGEGNGAECESSWFDFDSYIGEEISEPVMYFSGEGWGFDNDTGNPEAIEHENPTAENSAEENGNDECLNGEHADLPNSSNKNKLGNNVIINSSIPSVTKRSLKKQSNDTTEVLNTDSKKHCVRDLDQSDGSNSTKNTDNDLKNEVGNNDKNTIEPIVIPKKNNVKKGRGKVKKKSNVAKKVKLRNSEVVNSETENCHDSKTSIIEKRKSSVSSVDQEDLIPTENDKEKSPDKELKVEDPLPPKKLRLETTPESDGSTHSKETGDNVENGETNKDIVNNVETPITQRKKIKANKGKFKRKKALKENNVSIEKNNEKDSPNVNEKKESKSLKRSLLDTTVSGNNKTESQSETEDNEPISSGKRLKIKPKKIIMSKRKNKEAKLRAKQSSDESEEETLYSIAGKKTTKKLTKKKTKVKVKEKEKVSDEKKPKTGGTPDDNETPVRQSRRIAQMKIKEEAERRHLEEVALREMKKIHKKKNKDDEEEWVASGASSAEDNRRKPPTTWRSDSTGPEPDSESDEPLFELHEQEEPEVDHNKSDHEFSPESDLETGEPVEPLKRARTLQEEKDEGYCKRCGSAEQPEWILLCDKCDAGYHASCLKPVLFVVPEGDWFCPPCNHDMLIASLEAELVKFDELVVFVEAEKERKKLEEPVKKEESEEEKQVEKPKEDTDTSSEASGWSSSSSEGAVYRLRARRQLPVSYRSQEYDRLISSAIKEEYVEPTTSAGNQGRGKDISTIIEAAEEEKMKEEREALLQGRPIEKRLRKKQRRKPRKLNSLDVPSEDDDETDEDFKDTGMESSSEEISSSAERDSSNDSRSSDSVPLRRTCRSENKKDRPKLAESSPEVKKKKKGLFDDSSSESAGAKEWSSPSKPKSKSKRHESRPSKSKRRDKERRMKKKNRHRLTQYDADGNVIRARVTYGGLSGDEENDWSPKHRTRQKKINYTEMPNTESEDEMHKSSGKHMPDSSDEYKIDDSDATTDSDSDKKKKKKEEEAQLEEDEEQKRIALSELVTKTAVVPLQKLPDDVTRAKTEELHAHLSELAALNESQIPVPVPVRPVRGKGSRGGRGSRGSRGGRGGISAVVAPEPPAPDDALAKLIGVKIKDLRTDGPPIKPNQVDRERKRQEREAKLAEREAKKVERLQKKEEKEKMKELKAKEREEKRLARLALQESKRIKREKMEYAGPAPIPISHGPPGPRGPYPFGPHGPQLGPHGPPPHGPPGGPPGPPPEMRERPPVPRLQVRMELRGVLQPRTDHPPNALREGTLSVAGSPQPFKPISEEPSIITRMPHMINQQYRGPMMYPGGGSGYPARQPQNMSMYGLHARQYPPQYYGHVRALPPPGGYVRGPYPMRPPHGPSPPGHGPPGHGPSPPGHGPSPPGHGPPVHMNMHRPHVPGPPGALPPSTSPHGPPNSHPAGPAGPSPLTMLRGPPPNLGGPSGVSNRVPPSQSPSGPLRSTPPVDHELPVRIKAEVKQEPEAYRSPTGSPVREPSPVPVPREEPPRHPKIKVTENKDRRPRYPHGPYAPQYGPYGPYAPPPNPAERGVAPPRPPPPLHNPYAGDVRPRSPAPERQPHPLELTHGPPPPGPPYLPPHLRPLMRAPFGPVPERGSPGAAQFGPQYPEAPRSPPAPSPARLDTLVVPKLESPPPPPSRPVPADGVFGGLVSYFSSQHEDDIDA